MKLDADVKRKRVHLQSDVPSPIDPPPGCHFHTRCPIACKGLCDKDKPALRESAPGHWAACHLRGGVAAPMGGRCRLSRR